MFNSEINSDDFLMLIISLFSVHFYIIPWTVLNWTTINLKDVAFYFGGMNIWTRLPLHQLSFLCFHCSKIHKVQENYLFKTEQSLVSYIYLHHADRFLELKVLCIKLHPVRNNIRVYTVTYNVCGIIRGVARILSGRLGEEVRSGICYFIVTW